MKALHTLIKIQKNNIDMIMQEISLLNDSIDTIDQLIQQVKDEMQKEKQEFYLEPTFAGSLDKFLQNANKKVTNLDNQKQELLLSQEALREKLQDEYSKLKRYEIALENRQKQQRLRIEKLAENALNETSIIMYNYKQDQ